MDILARIKRLILARRYAFTNKARMEMALEEITEVEVLEAIVNAPGIYKGLRSRSPAKRRPRERLHVIVGATS